MRILILGEGPTDLGRFNQDGIPEQEGVLPVLVRKVLEQQAPGIDLEFRVRKLAIKVTKKPSQMVKESKHGYLSRLKAFLALPDGRWADAFVVVVDRDDKKYHSRLDELNEAREFLLGENKRCAVGMAIEEIEAWLLADEKALREVLEDDSIQRQPDPEKLDSRNDESDRNPTGRLSQLMKQALKREVQRDEYPDWCAQIAEQIDLAQLEARCPDGFCPFAEQIRQMATS